MKWFTYANFIDEISSHGTRKYRKNTWRANNKEADHVALVFGSDDPKEEPSKEDLIALAHNPEIQKFVGKVFFALRIRNIETSTYLVLTEHPDLIMNPDQAKLDEPPVLTYVDGEERIYHPRKRFSDCRTLLKALGCAKCPDNGWLCHSRALLRPGENEEIAALREYAPVSPEDVQGYFKHGVSKVEGFTFASPVMTKPLDVNQVNFLRGLRSVREHDFTAINHWTEQRSGASSKGAESRRFRRKQCAKCILGKSSCSGYRYCKGRFPSENKIVQYVLKDWTPRTHQLPKGIKPWQFWVTATCAGGEGKYQRRNVILAGIHWDGTWKISVCRRKTSIYEQFSTDSYDKVADIFNLPKTRKEALKRGLIVRPPSREARALWFKTQELHSGHRKAWGGTNDILVRTLTPQGAEIEFTNGRCIYGNTPISRFQDIFTRLGKDIGVPQLNGRGVKRRASS